MFSQTAEYALRAMSILAYRPSGLTPTPVLAELTKVPSNYLAKVLQTLASAELIVGRRGVGGGYRLARGAEDINLMDVINAVSPVDRITTCPLGIDEHGSTLCPLHRKMDEAAESVIGIFSGVTLADLVSETEVSKPLCDTKTVAELRVSAGSDDSVG